ncbi:MAG: zinc ribbon domain-containing protein [Christensenellales bacterium]
MAPYRKVLKDHYEGIPAWRSMLSMDYLFYGLGLLCLAIGSFLLTSPTALAAYGILAGIGRPLFFFGLFLAFVKQDDWGLLISTGVSCLYSLIVFFILIFNKFGYGAIGIPFIVESVCWGILFAFALKFSTVFARMKAESAARAAVYAQQAATMGTPCAKCGAIIPSGAGFCQRCGASKAAGPACSQCGAPLSPGAAFCLKCGQPVQQAPPTIKCPQCGADVKQGAAFCLKCGSKL